MNPIFRTESALPYLIMAVFSEQMRAISGRGKRFIHRNLSNLF